MIESVCSAQCESLESRVLFADAGAPTILFVRGATRSGGFLEATEAAARDLELADINNASTDNQNTGWATLAGALRDQGFAIEQMIEAKGVAGPWSGFYQGKPIRFDTLDLTQYTAIVFGSNNAHYPRYVVDAVENYVRNGGGAMFIADANFGSDWADASASDQSFLNRFGLTVNQDNAVVTTLRRSAGDFVVADHPVLAGVNTFEGEGVSTFIVPRVAPPETTITRLVAARGQTRDKDGADPATRFQGSLRSVNERDASVVLVNAGAGRVAAYFDRNTFFNANGRGTDITRHDNRQFALNLFHWVADNTSPAVTQGTFAQGAPSEIRLTFNDNLYGSLTRDDIFLRNGISGEPIPNARWYTQISDSPDGTVLSVFVKGAQPPGQYWMQINPFRISDDSGNANRQRVRFNFTISATQPLTDAAPNALATAQPNDQPARPRLFDELFGSEPIA
ncbi:MAG TPA: hypothetical protein VGR35_02920 [Tepidisphaeraceae bacterium]|nr:hypothetical protein [Tepidisphaeraceae bacterium]